MDAGKIKVSFATLKSIFEACIPAKNSDFNEKLRINLVRCLGNLLKVVQAEEMNELGELCHRATTMIANNIKSKESMKLKWNACHAAQSLMKNEQMFQPEFQSKWQNKIFDYLFHEVLTSTNFKVKISCVNAISSSEKRSYYGSLFNDCFKILIEVLISSNNLVDYNEYKHKENLQEEICLALGHFFLLINHEDVDNFVKIIEANQDTIKELWTKSINRMVPEKFERVSKVVEAFNLLHAEKSSPALHVIINCFGVN